MPIAVAIKKQAYILRGIVTGYYSQLGQDHWVIHEALPGKRNGYFIDIGAYDGRTCSNTYTLEKRFGWTGICVEPDPTSFAKLQKRRSCICDNSCVYGTHEEVAFLPCEEYGGIRKTLSKEHCDLLERCMGRSSQNTSNDLPLRTRTMKDIIETYEAPKVIDFISIDTQGSEFEILQGFPFETHIFLALTVEHCFQEHQRKKIFDLLISKGYFRKKESAYDDFYCHNSLLSAASHRS